MATSRFPSCRRHGWIHGLVWSPGTGRRSRRAAKMGPFSSGTLASSASRSRPSKIHECAAWLTRPPGPTYRLAWSPEGDHRSGIRGLRHSALEGAQPVVLRRNTSWARWFRQLRCLVPRREDTVLGRRRARTIRLWDAESGTHRTLPRPRQPRHLRGVVQGWANACLGQRTWNPLALEVRLEIRPKAEASRLKQDTHIILHLDFSHDGRLFASEEPISTYGIAEDSES